MVSFPDYFALYPSISVDPGTLEDYIKHNGDVKHHVDLMRSYEYDRYDVSTYLVTEAVFDEICHYAFKHPYILRSYHICNKNKIPFDKSMNDDINIQLEIIREFFPIFAFRDIIGDYLEFQSKFDSFSGLDTLPELD